MKRTVQAALLLAIVAGMLGSFLAVSTAGQKGVKSGKATAKKTTLRGDDSNVKHDEMKNNAGSADPGAPSKKGGKSRASLVILHANNHSRWYVKLYNNGDYFGTVGPYGDLYYYAGVGSHVLYGRADFDDGTVLTFGPTSYDVDSDFTWHLYP